MKWPLTVSAVVALAVATGMLALGISHNAQGEFCLDAALDPCQIDVSYAAGIAAAWFGSVFVGLAPACMLATVAYRKMRGPREGGVSN